MSGLESIAELAKWGRYSHSGKKLVLFFTGTLPYGVAIEFIRAGLTVVGGAWYGVGKNAGRAVLISGPEDAIAAILKRVRPPRNRGSQTAGNLLPW